jgi:hypothetical protein
VRKDKRSVPFPVPHSIIRVRSELGEVGGRFWWAHLRIFFIACSPNLSSAPPQTQNSAGEDIPDLSLIASITKDPNFSATTSARLPCECMALIKHGLTRKHHPNGFSYLAWKAVVPLPLASYCNLIQLKLRRKGKSDWSFLKLSSTF